jgi:hypothetical protein
MKDAHRDENIRNWDFKVDSFKIVVINHQISAEC